MRTGGGDHEGGAGGGLEDLLDVLEEDLGEGGNSRRAVVLVLAVHGADDGVRDVHRARDEQVVPARAVHEVAHLFCSGSKQRRRTAVKQPLTSSNRREVRMGLKQRPIMPSQSTTPWA